MRLYGAIQKVEPQDDGTARVHGIATSEAVDEQGEIVRADAMRAAIPDYMRFPALREMHQLSAAGTTLEAEVGEDGTTRIVAHVVDPVAVAKVKNQVYRGFSIGGRITQREPGNPKAITSLVLNEISLVDRPANPEATFDCWKASFEIDDGAAGVHPPGAARNLTPSAEVASKAFNSPIQVWACGVPDHRHLVKADALKCLEKRDAEPIEVRNAVTAATQVATARGEPTQEVQYADPGYQQDGKRRYPIDADSHIRAAWTYINKPANARKYNDSQLERIKGAIIAAWKDQIDKDGPPAAEDSVKAARAALTSTVWDIGHAVRLTVDLDWLKDALYREAAIENDDSAQPARLQAIIAELCSFLDELAVQETAEVLGDAGMDEFELAPGLLAMAAGAPGIMRLAALIQKGKPNMRKFAARILAKAKYSRGDQALVDMACLACDKCLEVGGLSAEEKQHLIIARERLFQAGAVPVDTADDNNPTPSMRPPVSDSLPDDGIGRASLELLGVVTAVLGKRERAHQHMMDVAHECISKLSDGILCGHAGKIGARHSKETMEHLEAAHDHLVTAGAACNTAGAGDFSPLIENERRASEFDPGDGTSRGDIAEKLADERSQKAALAKVLAEVVPMLERLTRRVDDIARTPLPPLTIAKGTVSVSKQQDRGSVSGSEPELSPEAIASAFQKMSKEEQTLTLIKASYANPIRVLGSAAGER